MMLDKDDFIEKATLIYNKGYNANLKPFTSILRLTRLPILRKNGFFMTVMQSSMLRTLDGLQQELKVAEKELEKTPDEEKKKRAQRVLVHQQWIRVLQTIADGIAWRAYQFNRPLLRVMSENESSGNLKQVGYDYVALLRSFLISAPRFTLRIANDLTRVLRIADITIFYPNNKIKLYEIKEKGKKIIDSTSILKGMRENNIFPKKQNLRHLVAQMTIINEKVDIPVVENGKVIKHIEIDIVNLDFNIKNHFSILKKLIRKANKDVIATSVVEEGYYIEVTAAEKLNESVLDGLKNIKSKAPEWAKLATESVVKVSNFDSFLDMGNEFPRNILPYSVLPLSASDCTRMMMGHLQVFISVDTSILRSKLIDRGWKIKDGNPWEQAVEIKIPRKHMFEQHGDSTLFHLEKDHEGATYYGAILLDDVLMMG